jgi:cell division protease FtsH
MHNLLLPIALLVMFIFLFSPMLRGSFSSNQSAYKLEDFQRDLASGDVQDVVITPNRNNDTGYAVVTRSDEERKILYATQIAEVERITRENGIEPTVKDIPSENTFMVSVLPTILIVAVCLLFFYLMNAQNMGG